MAHIPLPRNSFNLKEIIDKGKISKYGCVREYVWQNCSVVIEKWANGINDIIDVRVQNIHVRKRNRAYLLEEPKNNKEIKITKTKFEEIIKMVPKDYVLHINHLETVCRGVNSSEKIKNYAIKIKLIQEIIPMPIADIIIEEF